MAKRVLVVGGVAAGASAATKARRANEEAEIIMFEKGEYVSFANCGLPYYVSRDIKERDALLVVTPEQFNKRHNVDVRLQHEVTAIDRKAKTVTVKNHQDGSESVEKYDSLVLAPGAKPIRPPIPGIDAENVFGMTTIPDMDRVHAYIEEHGPKTAVVVGAGYIGVEMAEALMARGLKVTLVEKLPQVLPTMDADMAALVSNQMVQAGIRVVLGDGIAGFEQQKGHVTGLTTESGRSLPAELVVLSIGVRPNVALAENAGLELGSTGAIKVNPFMQTSDPNIWAAGDAVESVHKVTGEPAWIALAGPANKQGRVAGCNAVGGIGPAGEMTFGGVMGTSIVRFEDVTAASTGLNQRQVDAENIDYDVALIHAMNHAGYYPGADLMAVKMLYRKTDGRVLGAQAVGREGVDKRIDVFATAIAARMNINDVAELDLAYAPPFGSARDPVIVAAFVAQNQQRATAPPITSDELHELQQNGEEIQLIDVRTVDEHREMYIPGSILIPVDELRARIDEVDKDKPTVVYCRVGLRGYLGTRILMQNGVKDVRNLCGGIRSWRFEVISRGREPGEADVADASRA